MLFRFSLKEPVQSIMLCYSYMNILSSLKLRTHITSQKELFMLEVVQMFFPFAQLCYIRSALFRAFDYLCWFMVMLYQLANHPVLPHQYVNHLLAIKFYTSI
jgi:hypothetical protein